MHVRDRGRRLFLGKRRTDGKDGEHLSEHIAEAVTFSFQTEGDDPVEQAMEASGTMVKLGTPVYVPSEIEHPSCMIKITKIAKRE